MTCYLIGAVLHITCTGYAIFTFIFNRKINREHNKYVDSEGELYAFNPSSPLRAPINSEEMVEVEVGRHSLKKDQDGKYFLNTLGVLTDAELRHFIGRQLTPEQKRVMAIEGIRHQIATILKQDPIKSEKEGLVL